MLTKRVAYEKWLGIKDEQQPSLYRLLAIDAFESDPDIIANAADSRLGFVRQFQVGENANLAATILNEITRAKIILLNPQKKAAFDAQLREGSGSNPASDAEALKVAVPLASPLVLQARALDPNAPIAVAVSAPSAHLDLESFVASPKPKDPSKQHTKTSKPTTLIVSIAAASTIAVLCVAGGLAYLFLSGRNTTESAVNKSNAAGSPKPTAISPKATGETKVAAAKTPEINAKPASDETAGDDIGPTTIIPRPNSTPPSVKPRISDEERLAKDAAEISKRAKEVKTPEESKNVAEKAIVLVDRAIVLGKADTAKEVAVVALAAARSAESVFLSRQATLLLVQLQSPISDSLRQSARQRLGSMAADGAAETPVEPTERPASHGPSIDTSDDSAKLAAESHDAKWGKTEVERRRIFFDLLKAVDDYGMTSQGKKAWKDILARNAIDARVAIGILNEGFNTFSNWEQPDGGGKASSRMNRINWIGERTRSMSEPMLSD